jgi:RNA polymerase sigma factor (sigma-70 family)
MATLVTDSARKTPARLASSAVLACQSDERLVSLVRSGHERAFDAIVDRYRRPLLRYCRGILPESRAEDAVQQTFINAHASLADTDDPVRLKPWLFTIARNAALNMLRQNGWNYDQIPLDFDGVRRPDQIFEQRVELQQTVSALNDLPERQRSALVMREFEGRSYEEIARALGANDGAVRQLLNRARSALRTAATAVVPPPLVARMLSAGPPDGRRAAEVISGLGAAGVAKAGATALVAGSLVVGAVNVPLLSHDRPARGNASSAAGQSPASAASIADKSPALSVAAGIPVAAHRNDQPGGGSHGRGAANDNSGTNHGSQGASGDDRSGSSDHSGSGSGDDTHSGSGGGSGTEDTHRSGSSPGGSRTDSPEDSLPSGSGSPTSSGSSDASSSGPGSGSADQPTSGSGSSEPAPVDNSGPSLSAPAAAVIEEP